MQAVWMVRSRQIASKLTFWLALAGYDPNDHSISHRIYLVYAAIFWFFWFFAMFSLFAGAAADGLRQLGILPVNQAAAEISLLVLFGWGLYRLWQATRTSPIVFTEEDSYLICQTPAPGSAVALSWFLGDWFGPALPFWAGAVTLGFAMVEYRLNHQVGGQDVPAYVASGLQAVLVILLVQMGILALVWAVGMLRLQGDRRLTWQPGALRLGIGVAGVGLAYTVARHGLNGLSSAFWQTALWPLAFPLRAAFSVIPWSDGMWSGLAWAVLGLVALAWSGVHLSLIRAAQETVQKEKIETVQRFGQGDLARQLDLTRRMGTGHPPSRLPLRPGLWVLLRKDLLQSGRGLRLADAWGWIALCAASLGVCLAPDTGARGLALAFWAVLAGQRVTARLQKDLAHWTLLRQLPFSSQRLLLGELALPFGLVVLLGWIVLGIAGRGWIAPYLGAAFLLLPGLAASVSCAAAFDLFRQAKSAMLLNGSSPQFSTAGVLLDLVGGALPLGLWFGLSRIQIDGGGPAVVLSILVAWFFWNLAGRRLQTLG